MTSTPYPSMREPKSGLLGLIPLITGKRRLKFALTLISGILAQGGTLASFAIGAWIAGRAITGVPPQSLLPAIAFFAIVVLVAAGGRWWQAHISHDFAFSLIEQLQIGIYDGLERAAPARILGRQTGELASIATGDAELMEQFYAHTLADYIGAVIVPLAAVVALTFIAPLSALTLVPFLLLVASVPVWLSRRAGIEGERVMAELGQLNAVTVETIQGLPELTIFGRGRDAVTRLMQQTAALGAAQRRYGARAGLEHAAIDGLTALTTLTSVLVGLWLLRAGRIDIAALPLIIVISGAALRPIADVTQTARKLGELKAGARRILEVMRQKPLVADHGDAAMPADTTIRFENVEFGYGSGRATVLDAIELDFQPGESIALVGQSGAGKTTIANLLMRFWDVDSGRILISGTDIRDLPIEDLRRMIAYVPQDIHLFNRSIADNIRLGRPEATMEEVVLAAKIAQAHDFVVALTEGYETVCGAGGTSLSGGQRQRLAIARALITKARVLVLDEASSSLDMENEQAFQRALSGLRDARLTIIIIAHRPSSIRGADRIVVLDQGKVVETGTHQQLAGRGVIYRRLMALEELEQ